MHPANRKSGLFVALDFLTLLYHSSVREIRKQNGNALLAIFMEMLQTMIMVVVFYLFVLLLNRNGTLVRGSYLMFITMGVLLFMTHTKTVGKVAASNTATNALRIHAPVSALLLIGTGALSVLYIQVLASIILLLIIHVFIEPVVIDNYKRYALCFFLAWFSGVGIGVVFMSLTAFFPRIMKVGTLIFMRANMIFSGKMLVPRILAANVLPFFIWNPLFHLVDQARDAVFVNYTATMTNLAYPIYMSFGLLIVGFMIENYARKRVSASSLSRL